MVEVPVNKKPGLMADLAIYKRLHESMGDPFVSVAMTGAILDFNESYRKMLGYTADELKRLSYQELTPKKWHAYEERLVREQIIPQDYSIVYEKEYRRKDGVVFPVELRTFLIRNGKGEPEQMLAVVRDITNRKREQARLEGVLARLREANERLNFHVERMPLAHIVWDHDFRVVEWNPGAERIFGWTSEEAMGRHAFDLVVSSDLQREVGEAWNDIVVRGRRDATNVNENVTRDGRRIVCEWFNAPLRDDKGGVIGCISMAHDITERIRGEERIKALNAELEWRVGERTEALTQTVAALKREALRRKRAEKSLLLRQKQLVVLVSQLIVAESAERRRIADGLHDDVNQMLAAAKLITGRMREKCRGGCRERARHLDMLIDQVLVTTRTLTFDLSSTVLRRLGLKEALEDLCDKVRSKVLDVRFETDELTLHLDAEVEDFAFRSVKELLRNVQRHSGARKVRVSLKGVKGGLEASVEDDGVGPAAIKKSRFGPAGGFGLHAIRERLGYLGGWMRVQKAGIRGTRITLRMPLVPRVRTGAIVKESI